ncbi:hypothetical protein HK102_005635 [Quaeritorhiza haematococci]|nr:hypothetical protein HK102_005635 [Quaeritorhiza haematococci]
MAFDPNHNPLAPNIEAQITTAVSTFTLGLNDQVRAMMVAIATAISTQQSQQHQELREYVALLEETMGGELLKRPTMEEVNALMAHPPHHHDDHPQQNLQPLEERVHALEARIGDINSRIHVAWAANKTSQDGVVLLGSDCARRKRELLDEMADLKEQLRRVRARVNEFTEPRSVHRNLGSLRPTPTTPARGPSQSPRAEPTIHVDTACAPEGVITSRMQSAIADPKMPIPVASRSQNALEPASAASAASRRVSRCATATASTSVSADLATTSTGDKNTTVHISAAEPTLPTIRESSLITDAMQDVQSQQEQGGCNLPGAKTSTVSPGENENMTVAPFAVAAEPIRVEEPLVPAIPSSPWKMDAEQELQQQTEQGSSAGVAVTSIEKENEGVWGKVVNDAVQHPQVRKKKKSPKKRRMSKSVSPAAVSTATTTVTSAITATSREEERAVAAENTNAHVIADVATGGYDVNREERAEADPAVIEEIPIIAAQEKEAAPTADVVAVGVQINRVVGGDEERAVAEAQDMQQEDTKMEDAQEGPSRLPVPVSRVQKRKAAESEEFDENSTPRPSKRTRASTRADEHGEASSVTVIEGGRSVRRSTRVAARKLPTGCKGTNLVAKIRAEISGQL